jgi:hypothetical protein
MEALQYILEDLYVLLSFSEKQKMDWLALFLTIIVDLFQPVDTFCAFLSILFYISSLRPDVFPTLAAAVSLAGFFGVPTYAIGFVCASEYVYFVHYAFQSSKSFFFF